MISELFSLDKHALLFIDFIVSNKNMCKSVGIENIGTLHRAKPDSLFHLYLEKFKDNLLRLYFIENGIDLPDSLEKRTSPPLTDSILILNINLEKQKINLLSLPRDLYLKDYKSKINALYYYEQQQQKPQMATEIISSLIQKPIDCTVILQLNQIKELID